MNEGVCSRVEVDRARIAAAPGDALPRRESRADLDEALARARAAQAERRAAVHRPVGNAADVLAGAGRAAASCRTSSPTRRARTIRCNGYVPERACRYEAALRCARPTPKRYMRERAIAPWASTCARCSTCSSAAPSRFDYGNNIRAAGAEGRRGGRLRLPRLRARLHPPAVLRGQGPVPLGGALRRPGRHRRTDEAVLRALPATTRPSHRWITLARERVAFQGLPARICWLGYGERAKMGLAFNELVRTGEVSGAHRHRPRPPRRGLGGLAQPRDRSDARRLRRGRRLADPERAAQRRRRAPRWVSLHHGGGVGIGYSHPRRAW